MALKVSISYIDKVKYLNIKLFELYKHKLLFEFILYIDNDVGVAELKTFLKNMYLPVLDEKSLLFLQVLLQKNRTLLKKSFAKILVLSA